MKVNRIGRVATACLAVVVLAAGCSDGGGDEDLGDPVEQGQPSHPEATGAAPAVTLDEADALAVATTYADLVYASYGDAVAAVEEMRTAIDALVTTPSEATLAAARQTWVTARDSYLPTEAFRFYGGPIDRDGLLSRIDPAPIDEAHIDYTPESPGSGIVNDLAGVPEITLTTVVAAYGQDGQGRPTTGWHVIEYLLWGADTSPDTPGARPASDYESAPNSDRRGTYLRLLADLLVADLTAVRDMWAPGGGAYRAELLADPIGAVEKMLRGIGVLSASELADRWLGVPYESKDPDDERSRFSDNTHSDIAGCVRGIRSVYLADHPAVSGPSLSDVVSRLDPEVDDDMRRQLDNNVTAAEALPAPFDQAIRQDDGSAERSEIFDLIDDLRSQGQAIQDLAATLGLEISLEP